MKLVVGIATRGRGEIVRKTAEVIRKNCAHPNTKVIILGDSDDETLKGFEPPEGVELDIQPRPDSVAEKWNRMLKEPADLYLASADYRPQTTLGFDRFALEAAAIFPDGIGCVYQHMANLSFPCFQAITARAAEILGHMYVSHFPYWFVDHWLDDVMRMVGRFVYAKGDTIVYPRPNGGTMDMREPALWASLYDSLFRDREAEAEKLMAAMEEPEWRKNQLRRNFELIHQRSQLINSLVRGMPARDATTDERYARIRASGLSKLQANCDQLMKEAA